MNQDTIEKSPDRSPKHQIFYDSQTDNHKKVNSEIHMHFSTISSMNQDTIEKSPDQSPKSPIFYDFQAVSQRSDNAIQKIKSSSFFIPENLVIRGLEVELIPFSAGAHMCVFTLKACGVLVEDINNEELVFKKFNDKMLRERDDILEGKLFSSISHYKKSLDLKLNSSQNS